MSTLDHRKFACDAESVQHDGRETGVERAWIGSHVPFLGVDMYRKELELHSALVIRTAVERPRAG
jgi:hypothetical protein